MKHLIYNPGEKIGFVYTSNNTIPGSDCNFLALNVPRNKAERVGYNIMTNLAHFAVSSGVDHGHIAHCSGVYCYLKLVEGERKQALSRTHTTCTEPWTKLYELIPMFPHSDPQDWGGLPAFPDKRKEAMATKIIDNWRNRTFFVLHNEDLKGPVKRKYIDLAEALLHDDWNVDWTNRLSSAEIKLVRRHKTWFSDFAAVFFRKARGCLACKKLGEPGVVMSWCSGCKQVYYCSKSCQTKHWKKEHKRQCKLLQSRLDKDDPRNVIVNPAGGLNDVIAVVPSITPQQPL